MKKIKINKNGNKGKKKELTDLEEIREHLKTTRKQPSEKVRKVEIAKFEPVKPVVITTKKETLDLVEEQLEQSDTTTHSPDAERDMKKIKKSPEKYIENNMIKKSRLVDTFFIFADKKTFDYKDKSYNIIEEVVYLLPKRGYFIPTCYYREGFDKPVGFRQTNKGITGKALSLLYRHQLYETLLRTEDKSMNIFIILFNLATLIIFGVALYLLYQNPPEGGMGVSVILPWLGWF